MKLEISAVKPPFYEEAFPGIYDMFSHIEFAAGVPGPMFLITTRKENGSTNACLHAWSAFGGDAGGYYASLLGLGKNGHTKANLAREGEFCVNFLSPEWHKACLKTIECNSEEGADELLAAGLHPEEAKTVNAPRVAEAFLCYECRLERIEDLSGSDISVHVLGRVQHAAVAKGHVGAAALAGPQSFTIFYDNTLHPETGKLLSDDTVGTFTIQEEKK